MLHVIIGTDRKRARAALWRAARAGAEKHGANIMHVQEHPDAAKNIRDSLQGAGLFGERYMLVCDEVCGQEDARSTLFGLLSYCETMPLPCFVYEEKPDAEAKRILKKHAHTWEEFTSQAQKRDDGAFAVADALGRKDKKALWVSYVQALSRGASPEAIHGILFWKMKTLQGGGKAVYSQAQARRMLADIAALPHEARRNGMDMEYALERFLLGCV